MKRTLGSMYRYLIISLLWILCATSQGAQAQAKAINKIYVCDIKEEIAPPVRRKIQKAFKEAKEAKVDLIIIHMNTYGGMLDAADSIRTIILTSKIPVWVFIDNNAASAGALISIACDSIFMRPGANIGAATVVDQSGKPLPDKYQSYMRSMMRSTAEAKRRDPQIAQAMVDPRIVIPGIVDSTMVLTFTTEEAIKNGYCEGSFNSIAEILEKHNLTKATILTQKLSSLDNIIGFLINPFISGILVLLIIGGIYFELQTPGVGFPSIAAVVAALLYFAPLYLEGLAENWEILIFVLGVILLVIELFAIPGFGVIGFAGIVAIVTGLTLALVSNLGFDFSSVGFNSLLVALFTVVTATFISIIGSFFISKHIFTHRTFLGQLALVDVQNKNDGYSSADANYNTQVGKSGTARTILRPVGKVDIEGEIFDATAITGFIEKGETVLVVKYENAQLFVKKA